MAKKYVQVDSKIYDNKKIIFARLLKQDGQIDFNEPLEYFEECPYEDKQSPIYQTICSSTRKFINDRRHIVQDSKQLIEAVQGHIDYDEKCGYSTELLRERIKTLTIEERTQKNADACAYYNPFCHTLTLCIPSIQTMYHEVGHVKASDVIIRGDNLIAKVGLMELKSKLTSPFFTCDGSELRLKSDFEEMGRGFEESLNEQENANILGYNNMQPSFAKILDLLLDGNTKQLRSNMNLLNLIKELEKIISSSESTKSLIKALDGFYNLIKTSSLPFLLFGSSYELQAYEELSKYIIAKIIMEKEKNNYSENMLTRFLSWNNVNINIVPEVSKIHAKIISSIHR